MKGKTHEWAENKVDSTTRGTVWATSASRPGKIWATKTIYGAFKGINKTVNRSTATQVWATGRMATRLDEVDHQPEDSMRVSVGATIEKRLFAR